MNPEAEKSGSESRLKIWNEMSVGFTEGPVDYLWIFYTTFYSTKSEDRTTYFYVDSLSIYKEPSSRFSLDHEYLVATIKSTNSDDKKPYYLLFERTPGKWNKEQKKEEFVPEKLEDMIELLEREIEEDPTQFSPDRHLEDRAFNPKLRPKVQGTATPQGSSRGGKESISGIFGTASESTSYASESSSSGLILAEDSFQVIDSAQRHRDDTIVAKLQFGPPPELDARGKEREITLPSDRTMVQAIAATRSLKSLNPSLPPHTSHRTSPTRSIFRTSRGTLQSSTKKATPRQFSSSVPTDIHKVHNRPFFHPTSSPLSLPPARPHSIHHSTRPQSMPFTPQIEGYHHGAVYQQGSIPESGASSEISLPSAPTLDIPSQLSSPLNSPRLSDRIPSPRSDIEFDVTSPVSPVSPLTDDSDEQESDEEEDHDGDDDDNEVERDEVGVTDDHDDDELERVEIEVAKPDNHDPPDPRDEDDANVPMPPGPAPPLTHSSDSLPRYYFPLSRIPTNATGSSEGSITSLARRLILRRTVSTVTRDYDALPVQPGRPYIYLYELVTLACRLHKCKSLYQIFTRNCYWFAGMIFHVLRKFTRCGATLHDGAGNWKDLGQSDEVLSWINGGRMGTFMKAITVVKAPRMFTVDAIIRKWNGAVVRFRDQVEINRRDSKASSDAYIEHIIQVEQKKRDAADRKLLAEIREEERREAERRLEGALEVERGLAERAREEKREMELRLEEERREAEQKREVDRREAEQKREADRREVELRFQKEWKEVERMREEERRVVELRFEEKRKKYEEEMQRRLEAEVQKRLKEYQTATRSTRSPGQGLDPSSESSAEGE